MSTQPPQRTPEERKRFMENLAAETPDEAFDPQALLEQLHFFTDPATRDLTQHPPGVQEWLDKNAALAFKPENLTKIFKGATELEIQDRALKENVSFAEAGKRTLAADFEGDMNVLLASEGYLGRPEPAMVGDMGPAQFLPFNEMAGDSAPHLYNIIAFAISADPAELAQTYLFQSKKDGKQKRIDPKQCVCVVLCHLLKMRRAKPEEYNKFAAKLIRPEESVVEIQLLCDDLGLTLPWESKRKEKVKKGALL